MAGLIGCGKFFRFDRAGGLTCDNSLDLVPANIALLLQFDGVLVNIRKLDHLHREYIAEVEDVLRRDGLFSDINCRTDQTRRHGRCLQEGAES